MNEPPKCDRCGAPLPPDSPEGLCPRCLIAFNLATQTQITGETSPAKPAPAPPLPVSDVAKLFPQLEIIECLGRGGMGAVYKARQPRLDRFVALKILSPEKQGNQKFAERFEREARALAKLHHPNIVAVYDFGEANGNFYLLMEYVDGLTLRQLLQDRKLSPPEALAIVPKICDALQYAHTQGIVHRDIKPENILMDKAGHVKIADFGIAKIIGGGERANLTEAQAIGTPHYMSPEQIERPQAVDHRADIYSLGVVFYEMLTGELPLGKFQPPSKKVQVDVRLDEIVLRALEKEPERRYQQASEVKTQVETVAATAQPPDRQVEEPHAATRRPASIWNLIAIAAGVAAGFVIIAFLGLLAAIAIPNFVKGRRYAQASRDREINANSTQTTNLPASAESWSPTLAPGEKLDLGKILSSAKSLTDEGSYEDALQHYLWYFNHSRNDSGARGVRLSFALSDWIELGRRYPKARRALIEIRDADVRQFSNNGGYADLFQEITGLNQYLGDDDATVALFKSIESRDPQLAGECFGYAEETLFQKGDYQTCRKYLGDPQNAFDRIRQGWQQMKQFEQRDAARREEQKERLQAMAKTNVLFAHMPIFPGPPPFADDNFVHQTRQLIEILVATGSKGDAENIQSQSLAVLNDPRLKTAVEDAEAKMSGGNSAQDTENILAEQPPVVVETYPVSGARDVPAGETEIRVRFSKDMTDNSWSWSTAWENSTPDFIGNPHYESDSRTCVAKVKLEPGRTYAFWLNSDNFHNFKDTLGQPAVPYLLIFQTKALQTNQANLGVNHEFSSATTNHPQVVSVWPPDGTVNVETHQDIRIRFSQPMNPNDLDIMMSGGFLSYDQPRYDSNRNEFTIPFQLLPGTTNKLTVGWAGQGFRDTNGNPADEFHWQFTTRPSIAKADASPPHIVQIYPPKGQNLPVLTLLQLTFDRPMTLDEGFPYLRQTGGGFGPPSLISDIAYNSSTYRFTIPLVLPPDNETKLTLHGFYSADGIAADPIVIRCEIGTNNYSKEQLQDLSKAAETPRLIQLLTSMKAARAQCKSGIETVQLTMTYGEKSAFTGISVSSALFKWQGTNQFYEDISGPMNTKTFVLGTDAKTCWLYGGGGTQFPPYLNSSPVASVATIDTSIADPFNLIQETVKSVIAREKLIYEGQSQLDGRLYYRIGCWNVRQTGNDSFPIEAGKYEWWIDPVTFLPAQMASVQSGFRQILKFQYSGLNQPLPDSAFQPPDSNVAPEDWYKKKLAPGESRFLTIKDGSDGGMSGRLGRQGPNGTTSSGMN